MSRGELWLLVASLVIGLVAAGAVLAAPPGGSTVTVNCTIGQSINKALEKNTSGTLTIVIDGMCVEDVVIRDRTHVTLMGDDPMTDGVQAATAGLFGAPVLIEQSNLILLENLKLTGGAQSGLNVQDSNPQIDVRNCRLEGNGRFGAGLFQSRVLLEDVVIQNNGANCAGGRGRGLLAGGTALVTCTDCTIANNDGGEAGCDTGVQAAGASSVQLNGGSVSGGPAVLANGSGRANTFDTAVTGVPLAATPNSALAAAANTQGEVTIAGGTFTGDLSADDKSVINVRGFLDQSMVLQPAQQMPVGAGPTNNRMSKDSTLDVGTGGQLDAAGTTTFSLFSSGIFRSGSVPGALVCHAVSDAVCLSGAGAPTSSTCASCPAPP